MDSFQKRERERKKLQNRRDKADRKRERTEHGVPLVAETQADPAESSPPSETDAPEDGTKPEASPA